MSLEQDVKKFAEEYVKNGYEEYLSILNMEYARIKRDVIPHLNRFKEESELLMVGYSKNKHSKIKQHKFLKKLYKLYVDEKLFVAKCNKTAVLSEYGKYDTIGNTYFGDRAFEKNGSYNLCGGMAYPDIIDFDKTWKNAQSKTMKDIYSFRHKMYSELVNCNKQLDDVKCFLEEYVYNLDEKVNKKVNQIKNNDEKEFLKYVKTMLKLNNRVL